MHEFPQIPTEFVVDHPLLIDVTYNTGNPNDLSGSIESFSHVLGPQVLIRCPLSISSDDNNIKLLVGKQLDLDKLKPGGKSIEENQLYARGDSRLIEDRIIGVRKTGNGFLLFCGMCNGFCGYH